MLLRDAEWTVDGGEVRVQTELSKTMLPMVVNQRGREDCEELRCARQGRGR